MGSENSASLRDEFDGYKADIDSLRKDDQKDQHEFQHPSIADRQG